MNKGAIISPCGKYRYQLWRIWDERKPFCMFLLHNPSTADANTDDPTVRRCIGFAASWGYGGIYIGNISPFRSTNPKEMLSNPIDLLLPEENTKHLSSMHQRCDMHVAAYGIPVIKGLEIQYLSEEWHCIGVTRQGYPCHPLYLKKDLKPIPFKLK